VAGDCGYRARFWTEIHTRGCLLVHAFAPLEVSRRVTHAIPLGCSLLLPVGIANSIQTLKGCCRRVDCTQVRRQCCRCSGSHLEGGHGQRLRQLCPTERGGTVLGCERIFPLEEFVNWHFSVEDIIGVKTALWVYQYNKHELCHHADDVTHHPAI
jgi:hypothetical protein